MQMGLLNTNSHTSLSPKMPHAALRQKGCRVPGLGSLYWVTDLSTAVCPHL